MRYLYLKQRVVINLQKIFHFLQLYYPLIYLQFITTNRKRVRTIFIDITTQNNREIYRLVEIEFKNSCIDDFQVIKSFQYVIEDKKYILEEVLKNENLP